RIAPARRARTGAALSPNMKVRMASAANPQPRRTDNSAQARIRSIPDRSVADRPALYVGSVWRCVEASSEQAREAGKGEENRARKPDQHGGGVALRLALQPLVEGGGDAGQQQGPERDDQGGAIKHGLASHRHEAWQPAGREQDGQDQ